jgi:tetratricopeptide (TPR) repeat protein
MGLILMALSLPVHAADDVLSILGDSQDKKDAGEANKAAGIVEEKQGVDISPYKAIFPKAGKAQEAFFTMLAQGEFEKALIEYFPAFARTEMGKSANGQAMLSYLLVKNGMKVVGLEYLFQHVEPEKLAPFVSASLREDLTDTDPVWKMARLEWKPKWTEVFSPSVEVQVKSRKFITAKEVDELKNIIRVAAPGTRDRATIQWQLVVALALAGDSVTSAKLLNNLMASKENPVQPDLMNMTAARMLFEKGFMDAAIKYYRKVPTKSEYWLEAQEEMGWAYNRKGEPQNTIAITQSLVIPELQNIVGAETVFLRSLGLLKVCDYPGVVKSLSMFKSRFKPKTVELMKIAENPQIPVVNEFFAKMKKKRLQIREMGPFASKLPHLIERDEMLYQNLLLSQQLEKEAGLEQALAKRQLEANKDNKAVEADLATVQQMVTTAWASSDSTAYGRMKTLAQNEISNTHRLLQKLHIVEAEALQQTITAQQKVVKAIKKTNELEKKGSTGSQARDTVSFPAEDGQVWFDEIAHYKVDVVKGCQSIRQ